MGWLDRLCRVLEGAIAALLAAMVALVFGNVVMRYAFNSGIVVSEEISRWMFVWLCFLGAVVAVREHGHLGSDMLVSRLPPAGKKALLVAGLVAMLAVNALLLHGAWAQVVINRDVEAPVSGLSVGIFYFAGVAFALLASLMLLAELARVVSGRVRDDDLVMVRESEDLAALHADTPKEPRP